MIKMRAKMRVSSVIPAYEGEVINFNAVSKNGMYDEDGSDENNTFSKFTPSANLSMHINNPKLFGKLKINEEYYVDFSEVDKE